MHGRHTFILYLMLFFLVICTLPTLLTSLPIVCTRDCTPSCETCPRYFSCFRFKVYFQFLNTLPRYPWIPPSALCLLQTEPSFLYSNRYIFVRQVVIKKVGYRVIPLPLAFRNLLSATKPPVRVATPMNSHNTRYHIRTPKTPWCLEMFS
jgi:hypothetical protein